MRSHLFLPLLCSHKVFERDNFFVVLRSFHGNYLYNSFNSFGTLGKAEEDVGAVTLRHKIKFPVVQANLHFKFGPKRLHVAKKSRTQKITTTFKLGDRCLRDTKALSHFCLGNPAILP